MQKHLDRPSPSARWLPVALALPLAFLGAACGGGGNDEIAGGANDGGNQDGERVDWDQLVWDEDDWS